MVWRLQSEGLGYVYFCTLYLVEFYIVLRMCSENVVVFVITTILQASLGGSRPSIAAFLFYKTLFGWQKLRAKGNGGNSCSNDLFDRGIYLGSEGLSVPLDGEDPRRVTSRLGFFFETGPSDLSTLLPTAGQDARLQELKVLVGVYEKNEDIPNSGGVLDLGLY